LLKNLITSSPAAIESVPAARVPRLTAYPARECCFQNHPFNERRFRFRVGALERQRADTRWALVYQKISPLSKCSYQKWKCFQITPYQKSF
jgi:hypothetical protein